MNNLKERSDNTWEKESEISSVVCSITDPVVQILNTVKVEELNLENLLYQLQVLKSMDAGSFFCWDPWSFLDNNWAHVWFIQNYTWLHELFLYWDDEASSIAGEIITIIQQTVKENLKTLVDQEKFLDVVAIAESLSNYWSHELYLHGFRTYIEALKWNVDVLSVKWYPNL